MILQDVTADGALHVAAGMRDADYREIFATRWNDDLVDLTVDCLNARRFSWIACADDGTPVAVVGAWPTHPGVWQVYFFTTDRWSQISLSLTRWIRRVMIPALRNAGAHRAECKSLSSHTEAHRWLEFLGASQEATLRGYGKDGEDFLLFVWTR